MGAALASEDEQQPHRRPPKADWKVGDLVVVEGCKGNVTWDGRPKHQYAKVAYLSDPNRRELVDASKISPVVQDPLTGTAGSNITPRSPAESPLPRDASPDAGESGQPGGLLLSRTLSVGETAPCPRRLERCASLEDGEAETNAFAQYVYRLEEEQQDELKRHRNCGALGTCGGQREKTTRLFAHIMQEMIQKLLTTTPTMRMRVFDNQTVHFSMEGQPDAVFTESRTTQFKRLRDLVGISDDDFRESMCGQPFLGGETEKSGKSGSLFLRSHDNRFVLKTVEEHEFDTLYEILPNYVLYLEENTSSLLCRFVALYSLTVKGHQLHFVVMANVLPEKAPLGIYDLKGTTEDRWVDPLQESVLKDNNFRTCSIVISDARERKRLIQNVRDDAEFLESLGLMDYSLLIGISPADAASSSNGAASITRIAVGDLYASDGAQAQACVFQLGIIDYLQRWTPKKVAAFWMKKPTLGCCHEIDTEPPSRYCSRFYKYADRKFKRAPNKLGDPKDNPVCLTRSSTPR